MIIQSLLDQDLYKLTMQQVVLERFQGAQVTYRFKCRNEGIDLRPYKDRIEAEVRRLCGLRFNRAELDYLATIRFIKPSYLALLRLFQLDFEHFRIWNDTELHISVEGPWWAAIFYEIFVLAIVNEVYFEDKPADLALGREKLKQKIALLKDVPGFRLVDFGTRRRYSRAWQEEVISTLKDQCPALVGTSNVWLAMKYNLTPIGTFAHEYPMCLSALGPKLADSQKFALQTWADVYRGDLGIALSDTYGMDAFLRDFDMYFAKLFDGARHDSGDPYEWCEKLIRHYESMRIDPRTKTAVFSDGLTMDSAIAIYRAFKDRIGMSFGIGTSLTNDVGLMPLNIVMKAVSCNGQPVVKLSDSPGKQMCEDQSFIEYARKVFKIQGGPL